MISPALIPSIVERADDYLGFFADLGASQVGFNVEESEGGNTTARFEPGQVDTFWRMLFNTWVSRGGIPRVRDFDRVLSYAQASLDGDAPTPVVDLLPTISYRGDVVLLSPELAGYQSARYQDFVVGNVGTDPLRMILERGMSADYVAEYQAGSARCRDECAYFDFCHAGQAANRYFEHGDFLTNETAFCRHSRQAPFNAVLGSQGPVQRGGESIHDHQR